MIKKSAVTKVVVIVVLACFVFACLLDSKKEQNTIFLPEVSFLGTSEKIHAKYYKDGFDFNYEFVPQLVLSESSGILQISLADNFENVVQLGENYYIFKSKIGVCEKKTYDLAKNKSGVISLPINKREEGQEEVGYYFIHNKQGVFVFKVALLLNPNK